MYGDDLATSGPDLGSKTISVSRILHGRIVDVAARLERKTGRAITYAEVVERAVDLLEKKLRGESGE